MIYFAHAVGTELVKIGYTAGPPLARLASLQTGCPHKLELLASFAGAEQDEARLHAEFSDSRVNGEWFKLTPRLNVAIAREQLRQEFSYVADVEIMRLWERVLWAVEKITLLADATGVELNPVKDPAVEEFKALLNARDRLAGGK